MNNNKSYDKNAQRKKNLDTFGAESLHNNQRRRYGGGYRGRGRGGGRRRGNGRGRGKFGDLLLCPTTHLKRPSNMHFVLL